MADMTPTEKDAYWDSLFRAGEATPIGSVSPGVVGSTGKWAKLKKYGKRFGPELIGWMLLERFLSGRHESKMRDIQKESARQQVTSTTPESLYYQATLPQAQQEEEMARTALLTHLSGGVIGPSLARGERQIGG